MVRAKFWVQSVSRWGTQEKPGGGTVKLMPVYSVDPTHENKSFWDATPQGEITLGISNVKAYEVFEQQLGREFYVDFTPAS